MIGETAQLILNRMKSNPEEFFRSGSQRWHWIFSEDTKSLLTEEERDTLQAEYDEVRKKEFHSKVLETILEGDQPTSGNLIYSKAGNLGLGVQSPSKYVFSSDANTATGAYIGNSIVEGGGVVNANPLGLLKRNIEELKKDIEDFKIRASEAKEASE